MSSRILRTVPHSRLLLVVFVLLVLGLWKQNVVGEEDSSNANGDSIAATAAGVCNINLNNFLPLPYSNLPNMICKPVWNTYFLRYSRTRDNVVTIVLSATYTTGWVGIGFSKDGMMLNSSAIVGWITEKGVARIKQYYLSGFTPEDIKPDKGELPLTSVPPFVTVYGATIYLAFQLNFAALSKKQAILLAFGTRYPVHHHLTLHNDKTTIRFDFSAGSVDYSSATSSSGPNDISSSKKAHGVLALLGWGLILPAGAIFARYLKHRDPLWYYLHVVIQFVGFIIALAAVVVGRSLYDRISANIPAHRGVGIFALVLSILQVLAFFLRPDKESKNRRYWNWYHHWFGRVALFFGTLNIVLGIHYAHAGDEWKIGFGFVFGIILFSCVVLEVLLRMRRPKEVPPPLDFQMNPF